MGFPLFLVGLMVVLCGTITLGSGPQSDAAAGFCYVGLGMLCLAGAAWAGVEDRGRRRWD